MATDDAPVPVAPPRDGLQNSPVDATPPVVDPVSSNVIFCYRNDQPFLRGARICSAGRVLECNRGASGPYWYDTGETC